jgi:hypothetical protein
LQAEPKILNKIIETPNRPIKTKQNLKKTVFRNLKSGKEPKICMTGRNWQAWPKILKIIYEHQINKSERRWNLAVAEFSKHVAESSSHVAKSGSHLADSSRIKQSIIFFLISFCFLSFLIVS